MTLEGGTCYCGTSDHHIFDSRSSADVCTACGVVIEQVLCDSPEYQYSGDGVDNGFHGLENYSIYIDDGRALTKRLQASLLTPAETDARHTREILSTICGAFRIPLPNVIMDTAVCIASAYRERVVLSGRKRTAVIAASFYYSCKIHNSAREIRTISTVCSMDIKLINFGIKTIRETLNESTYMVSSEGKTSSSSHTLARQFIQLLDIDNDKHSALCKSVLDMIDVTADVFSSGKKPRTIISSLIIINLFRLNIKFDKRDVAREFKVCIQSIDRCMRDLRKEYDIDF